MALPGIRVTCEFAAQLTHLVRCDKRALAQTPRLVHIAYAIVGIMRDGRIHSATKRWRLGALSQTPPRNDNVAGTAAAKVGLTSAYLA